MDLDNITDRLVASRHERLASKDGRLSEVLLEREHSRDQRSSSLEKKNTLVESQKRPKLKLNHTNSRDYADNERNPIDRSQSEFCRKSNKRVNSSEPRNEDEMLQNLEKLETEEGKK